MESILTWNFARGIITYVYQSQGSRRIQSSANWLICLAMIPKLDRKRTQKFLYVNAGDLGDTGVGR
jgi:hypothetical protein